MLLNLELVTAQTAADSLAIVHASWQVKSLQKGIKSKCALFKNLYGSPQSINIIEIDPRHYRAAIGVADSMMHTGRQAKELNAVAAINGSYFDMKRGNSVCYLKLGKAVIDTTTTSEFNLRVTGALLIKKGKVSLKPWSKAIEKCYRSRKTDVLASGPLMLDNGRLADWSKCEESFIQTRHPRSAIALSKEGKVWLIAIDGRSPDNAAGMSIPELAYLIRILGGKDSLNLDGGGSTTLWTTEGVVNHPTDNRKFDHEGERKVPNVVYFYKR